MAHNDRTEKTNAMRALDRAHASYTSRTYLAEGKELSPEDAPSGVEAAGVEGAGALGSTGVSETEGAGADWIWQKHWVIPSHLFIRQWHRF